MLEVRYSPTLAGAHDRRLALHGGLSLRPTEPTLNRFLPTVVTHTGAAEHEAGPQGDPEAQDQPQQQETGNDKETHQERVGAGPQGPAATASTRFSMRTRSRTCPLPARARGHREGCGRRRKGEAGAAASVRRLPEISATCQKTSQQRRRRKQNPCQLPILIAAPFAPLRCCAVFNSPHTGYRLQAHPVLPPGRALPLPDIDLDAERRRFA